MRARQVAEAHQEFVDDLAAGETEGPAKQLDPFGQRERVVRIEPGGERPMRAAQLLNARSVVYNRRDLQPIADDAGVGHQPVEIRRPERGDLVYRIAGKGRVKGV